MNEIEWKKFITDNLRSAGKEIQPPRELLSKIILAAGRRDFSQSPEKVTAKGNWHSYFSFTFGQKIFIPTGVVMILAVILFSLPANLRSVHHSAINKPKPGLVSQTKLEDIAADQDINNQTPTTDDVDEAVTAIVSSISDEDSTLTSDVDDESLSDQDGAAINNLMQNYDQIQF